MTLVFPVGISGSGKSRLYDVSMPKDMVLVCPDDIRREVNGSISDQSNGAKIFEIAHERTIVALAEGKDVYFSATNLVSVNIMDMLNKIIEHIPSEDLDIAFYILTDSYKPELCYSRVKSDLEDGIDRSNVPEEVIMKQHQRFLSMVNNLEKGILKNFLEENKIMYTVNRV